MGIIAVALGFGGILGLYGALLQVLSHALAKSVLFLASGDVSLRYKTREAAGVSGLLAAVPVTGGALLLGLVRGARLAAVRGVPVRAHDRAGRVRPRQPDVPAAAARPARRGVLRLRPDDHRDGDRQPAASPSRPALTGAGRRSR